MADDGQKQIWGRMKKCPVCEREFWCYDTRQWAYRERTKGEKRKGYICSWSCQAKHNAKLEQQNKNAQKYMPPKSTDAVRKPADSVRKKPEAGAVRSWYWLGNLGKIMGERGITDGRLAQRIGAKRSTLASWRRMESKCPEHKLNAVADALGIRPEDLVT